MPKTLIAENRLHSFSRYIGSEENPESKERREIGNVTAEMEISFEFGIRKKNKPKPKGGQLECITEVSSSLEGILSPHVDCSRSVGQCIFELLYIVYVKFYINNFFLLVFILIHYNQEYQEIGCSSFIQRLLAD